MKKKPNPKREKLLLNKLVIFAMLGVEALDELDPNSPYMLKYKKTIEEFVGVTDAFLDDVYRNNSDTNASTTYVSQISHKIDTMMRHFKPLNEDSMVDLKPLVKMSLDEFRELFSNDFAEDLMLSYIRSLDSLFGLHRLISLYGNFDTYEELIKRGFDVTFRLSRQQ